MQCQSDRAVWSPDRGFSLRAVDTASTPGFEGGKAAAAARTAPRRRPARDAAGAAVRREPIRRSARGAAGAAGDGHGGQGRCHRARRRRRRPAGRAASTAFKKPTDEELSHDFLWRVRKQLPQPGHHRRLRPVALRGRAHRPGARSGRAGDDRGRYAADRRLRGAVAAAGTTIDQGHAAHLPRGTEARGWPPAWTDPTSTGSTTPATWTSARSGRSTRTRTSSPSSAPRTERGALVRRSGRPQVVRAPRGAAVAPGCAGLAGAAVAAAGLRRRGRAGPLAAS